MSDNDSSNQAAPSEDGSVESKRPRLTRSAVKTQNVESTSAGDQDKSEESRNASVEENRPTSCGAEAKSSKPSSSTNNGVVSEQRITRGSVQMHPYSDRSIRVGRDFQVEIPDSDVLNGCGQSVVEKAVCLWTPEAANAIKESDLEEFCEIARIQYAYSIEQSLGMLHYHNYNIEEALADLNNFCPTKDEWSTEDKVLFEQAFSFHGKNFTRIKLLLPHKSMASLVDYYYSWKKTRNFTSYLDNETEQQDSSESDSDEENESNSEVKKEEKKPCDNCRHLTSQGNTTNVGHLCNACHLYWKRSGEMRPCKKKPENTENNERKKGQKCPKGFDLVLEQLREFAKPNLEAENSASSSEQAKDKAETQGEAYLKQLDTRIYGLRAKAVKNSQFIEKFAKENELLHPTGGINQYRLAKTQKCRTSHRWTDKDKMLAVQGFRKYGRNFQAISEVVLTKNAEAIKCFFRDNRERYKLDKLVEDFEKEKEAKRKELEQENLKAVEVSECIELVDDDVNDEQPDKTSPNGQLTTTGVTEEVTGEKMTAEG